MAYSEELALRIKAGTKGIPDLFEKKMFGGVIFMYKNKMSIGVVRNELVVRVVSEKMESILTRDSVRPMDFTKKPMKEFVYVSEDGFETNKELQEWIELGIEHAERASLK